MPDNDPIQFEQPFIREPATRLEDIHLTLLPGPLLKSEAMTAFYEQSLNGVRGNDRINRIARELEGCFNKTHYQALLVGHSGSGKSTEITRLQGLVREKFELIRVSVATQLDPGNFQPFDVLLVMLADAVEKTAKILKDKGWIQLPFGDRLEKLHQWFGKSEEVERRTTTIGAEAAAGIDLAKNSFWARALGLFATVRAEARYSSTRDKSVIKYQLTRLDELISIANLILAQCNDELRRATGKEWIFIGEDFDKQGVDPERVLDLFVTNSNALKLLHAHFIFTVPIALVRSSHVHSLPVAANRVIVLPDVMVYDKDHNPEQAGREAIAKLLNRRLLPELFAPGQQNRLIEASGGNIRELFSLVLEAANNALDRLDGLAASNQQQGILPKVGQADRVITPDDARKAILTRRSSYRNQLGQSEFDTRRLSEGKRTPITYAEKAERLVQIYNRDPGHDVPDDVLYSLLQSRVVQEFNGEIWYGVHPLVVSILIEHTKLDPGSPGSVDLGR